MPERLLVVGVRWLALFLLVVAILLIIVRWKFPQRREPTESTLEFWKRMLRRWRDRRADQQDRAESLRALRGRSALLIDPDEKSARVMAWKLTNLGCKVTRHRSGTQAINQAGKRPVDVVICDALLPDVGAADLFHSLATPVPVIFVGVMRDQWDELRGLGRNVRCMGKPYDPEEVAALAGYMMRRGPG